MQWLSKAEYDLLRATLDHANQRAEVAEKALAAERAANRESERHFADMILRKAGSYPQPKKQPEPVSDEPSEPTSEVSGMDTGELAAIVAVGAENGHSRADVISTLRRERGLT
jgi:hypothetical protein